MEDTGSLPGPMSRQLKFFCQDISACLCSDPSQGRANVSWKIGESVRQKRCYSRNLIFWYITTITKD